MKSTSNLKPNISNNRANQRGAGSDGRSRKKVYVGMSGGVDSSVSALLLKQQGYDVTGVFIKVWQPDNTECGWKDERRDAMRVAALLDIPFRTFDFSEQYKREVVDYMVTDYKAGRTPNPDIMCNRHVKFGSFLQQALADGIDYVATGHYAQNIFIENSGRFELREGADKNKDQSYFLWTLTQEDLEHVLFPIGHLQKSEVRKIAERHGLPVFDKKDSQGVCFIGHLDMKEFLKSYIETVKGKVLDTEGRVIGEHEGAALYTIGERHGFTLHNDGEASEPYFIVAKNIAENTITVMPKSLRDDKRSGNHAGPTEVGLLHVNLESVLAAPASASAVESSGLKCSARIRYRQERQACTLVQVAVSGIKNAVKKDTHGRNDISSSNGSDGEIKWKVIFDEPQKGAAEGQSVVLYSKNGDACLGGGILGFI